ncbi:hypothetical protein C8F04DRAFT_1200287 [Mycena alexandri]|uniref:Uncharacterized protein n=1 Tax=Mycena alexandri TaxID=1745969 RepID=A0AAD6WM46_9AGAR|nr:hypothetical protein C8F04DRAFT_1200287 [Mycena alexandri]
MPRPLPELSPDTVAALQISSRRAQALVTEAREIRRDNHAEDMRLLSEVYWDLGHPQSWTPDARELSWEYVRRLAENTLYHYVPPRYAKILRARLRRYERLKYLHELEHPLFTHPEFPEHPAATMWREGVSSTTKGLAGWGSQLVGDESVASKLTEDDDEISPI